jgi:uncharacterized membrane protein
MSIIGFALFHENVNAANKISGMLVGLYTGGTPNLMAIGIALGINENSIVITNTVDLIIGGLYFFLLISIMPKLVDRFLPSANYTYSTDNDLINHLTSEFIPTKQPFSFLNILKNISLCFLP